MLAEQFSVYVRNAVTHLPDRQRTVIEHHFFQGLTYERIASILSVSPQRCKQIATEAIIRLRTGQDAAALITLSDDRFGNVLKGTGFTAWKETGCSIQEKIIIRLDEKKTEREKKIKYFVDRGMPREKAELLFPVKMDGKYVATRRAQINFSIGDRNIHIIPVKELKNGGE